MESQEIGLSSICFGGSLEETLYPLPSHLHPTTHPQYLQYPLFPSHYWGMSHRTPCFYMSSKVSPCGAEMLGWMSAECSIKQLLAQYQQQQQQQQQQRSSTVYCITLMGWSNMLRSGMDRDWSISTIAVLLSLSWTNLSFLPHEWCEARWMDEKDSGSRMWRDMST